MATKLQVRRGPKEDLPLLSPGELGLCTDAGELYIGTLAGNIFLNPSAIDWSKVTGKPLVYPPSTHAHTKSDVSDWAHKHAKGDIADFPTSMPANGGNAATAFEATTLARMRRTLDGFDLGIKSKIPVVDPLGNFVVCNNIVFSTFSDVTKWTARIQCNGNQSLYFQSSEEQEFYMCLGVRESRWSLSPAYNGRLNLGSPTYKWIDVFANNGTIVTSDAAKKRDIAPIADNEKIITLMRKLKPVSYRFIEELSTSGRTHTGLIAQEVEAAMEECGITSIDFAGFIKSPVYEQVEKVNEDGQTYIEDGKIIPDKFEYGLRYEEFIAPMLALVQIQQAQIDALTARLDAMEG